MKRLLGSMVRFGLLGALSFVVNVGLTVLLHEGLRVSEERAFAVALVAVLAMNFLLLRHVVFRSADGDPTRQAGAYLISAIGFRAGEYLAFLVAHSVAGAPYLPVMFFVLAASTCLKFFVYRSRVFVAGDSAGSRVPLQVVLLLLAPAIVFGNTLHNELHLDSIYRVSTNAELERVRPVLRHFIDPRTGSSIPQIAQYRPLLPLSLSIDTALADAAGVERLVVYHAGNIAIHAMVTLLAFFLFRQLARYELRGPPPPGRLLEVPFVAAMLFAIHPVAGVPVNYICARDLTLMLLFLLASLLVYVRMRRRGDSWGGWAAASALFGLSLLCKQNGVVAPLLVFAFELLVVKRGGLRAALLRSAPFAGLVAAWFAWTELGLDFSDLDQLQSSGVGSVAYAWTMARVHLAYYLRNAVWPFSMRALPQIDPATGPFEPGVLLGGLFIVGTLVLAFVLRRRAGVVAWSVLSYWILFAPTSSIRPFRSLATDYRQVPSLVFLCLLFALAWARIPWRGLRIAVIALVFVYLGFSSHSINRIWRTERSFWGHSVRLGATSQAHMNYALSVQGEEPETAERHYLEAIDQSPGHAYAHINLGLLYIHRGRIEDGLAYVRKAVDFAPTWGLTHHWLAEAYRRTERHDDARRESVVAADLDPRNPEYQYQAALGLQQQGRVAESMPYLERAMAARPGYDLTRFLYGFALQQAGRFAEAEPVYRRFVADRPRHAGAWFNLGYGLIEAERLDEAIQALETCLRIDPKHLDAWHNLGYAQRLSGRPRQAVESLQQVLTLDPQRSISLYELARAQIDDGRPEQARETLLRLLRVDPQHEHGRLLLGRVSSP